MKILNVSSTLDPVTGGGEAERSYQMSRFLSQSKIDCQILTIDHGLDAERKAFLGKGGVVALPWISRRYYIPRVSFSKIDSLVREADVVHLMGHWHILNALVYISARKLNKPYVICPAGSLLIFGRSMWFKKLYNSIVGKKIIKNASMCIAITPDEENLFLEYGVSKNRIQIIPNGIAEIDFQSNNDSLFRQKYSLGSRPFVLFVGRLNLIKGPDLLLKAFCRLKDQLPGLDLVYAGPDGGMLDELRNVVLAERLTDRVHFLGYLGETDKSDAYHSADFLVIPSRHEAMSIVVLEAGVCGTPVLITDQCGFNQIAETGGGWVVPATVDGLENGLLKVVSDPGRLKVGGLKIKKFVMNNYSWKVIVQNFTELYSSILNNQSTQPDNKELR
jgi:glycosyltransferase involved in cell wall biosynthesis